MRFFKLAIAIATLSLANSAESLGQQGRWNYQISGQPPQHLVNHQIHYIQPQYAQLIETDPIHYRQGDDWAPTAAPTTNSRPKSIFQKPDWMRKFKLPSLIQKQQPEDSHVHFVLTDSNSTGSPAIGQIDQGPPEEPAAPQNAFEREVDHLPKPKWQLSNIPGLSSLWKKEDPIVFAPLTLPRPSPATDPASIENPNFSTAMPLPNRR